MNKGKNFIIALALVGLSAGAINAQTWDIGVPPNTASVKADSPIKDTELGIVSVPVILEQ